MKSAKTLLYRRSLIFGGLIVLLFFSLNTTLYAQKKTKSKRQMKSTAILPMPSEEDLQTMTERVLLDFNEAVRLADFSGFYSRICAPWKEQTSAEELQKVFQGFIDKKIDISGIISYSAVFTAKPVIKPFIGYYTLVLEGYYETTPRRTKFQLHFIPEDDEWKLSQIEIDTTSS